MVVAAAADLERIAELERVIGASLERVWENVLDWEHLPWLHSDAFAAIELVEAGDWGWRARVCSAGRPDEPMTIELRVEHDRERYVARTIEGPGRGTEIWTYLDPRGDDATAIRVEFWLPDVPDAGRESIGRGLVDLYQHLWDEDEQMMRLRSGRLATAPDRSAKDVDLGPRAELAARLPLVVDAGSDRWRVVDVDGELVVHSATCPHMLGPLGEDEKQNEGFAPHQVRCPWHGYLFDVRSGRSCDGRSLRLRPPPKLELRGEDGHAILHFGRT